MIRTTPLRIAAISLLSLTMAGCGGGGGSSSTTAVPTPVIPPATTTPTPTPQPEGDNAVVADYLITEQNNSLVRYGIGNTIDYDISYHYLGNQFSDPARLLGSYNVEYALSTNPLMFEGGVETMTKVITTDIKNVDDERDLALHRDEVEEVIQFPADWGDIPSSTEWVFNEVKRGVKYTSPSESEGILLIPGNPHIGYESAISYTKIRYSSLTSSDKENLIVEDVLSIDDIDIIQTPLGSFEAYRLVHSYLQTDEMGAIVTRKGLYWLHPSIGIIKARFSVFNSFEASNIDYIYTINDTNLSY